MDLDSPMFLPSLNLGSSKSEIGDPKPIDRFTSRLIEGSDPSKPKTILVISLGTVWQQDFFQMTHDGLIDSLWDRSNVVWASTNRHMRAFSEHGPIPHAVLVTDPGLFRGGNVTWLLWLVRYARRGGIVVFGGTFASGVSSRQLNGHFKYTLELPWTISELPNEDDVLSVPETWDHVRYRASGFGPKLERNSRVLDDEVKAVLPESFRCTNYARFFSNLAPQEAWYLPAEAVSEPSTVAASQTSLASEGSGETGERGETGESETSEKSEESPHPVGPDDSAAEGDANDSRASDAPPVWNQSYLEPSKWTKSPFAYGALGEGKVGFVGDFNRDCPEATFNITLAMLRVLPSSGENQSSSPPPASLT